MTEVTLQTASARFGKSVKAKLSNPAVMGEPEDQLRAPLEQLVADLSVLCGLPQGAVTLIGETRLGDLKIRPDYTVSLRNAQAGHIEIKAPGKGADPRAFKKGHDATQWEKLQPLPNLIYTDGNEWSLWRYGKLEGDIVRASGDVRSAGAKLEFPHGLLALIESFIKWQPTAPRDAKQLAETTARLCKLLRSEVAEQLAHRNPALTSLAKDWRKLLFPDATDERFADGYAQAVTFGLLMARARKIRLASGLDRVAQELRATNSLIGTALRLLTDDTENQNTLKMSLGTLVRVLDAVNWLQVSRGDTDAWLYFYEDFLSEYDNDLRKQTGSYYTPPEVVKSMVRLVHDVLRSRFAQPAGLASPAVTIADPAVGTGTFLLGVLNKIASAVKDDEGEGAVPEAIEAAISRLIAFEMQLGPFAVAQLRMMGELKALTGEVPRTPLRMYVTDTLGNPFAEVEEMGALYKGIAESRKLANEIKKHEKITVVIGNPPYKEKAKGRGGWVESGGEHTGAPLLAWMPPRDWGVGAHAKHLRNLYIYFWRWATWKVFDQNPAESTGVVCFITVAGFLNGPGFQKMRDYLRRTAGEVWVIDCSPEGHQPEVNTRIFQGVQHPVCIVVVSRPPDIGDGETPAVVRYRAVPKGHRTDKFEALAKIALDDGGWIECPSGWRDAFLPLATGAWASFPKLEDLFNYNGSGVMPGRTWVIAPDAESLTERWKALVNAPAASKETLFHPHLRGGKVGDKHVGKVVKQGIGSFSASIKPIAEETGDSLPPERYAFRSFDRQWIIPDARVINQPNPTLWAAHSQGQVYLTAPTDRSPTNGPALSFTSLIPDLHHYNGRGGRAFPLYADADCDEVNIAPGVVTLLAERLDFDLTAEDIFAYIAAIAAHPAYTARFKPDLVHPGLRIPLTADAGLFAEAAAIGREVIWLHTFGERFADAKQGRPASPPRLPKADAPKVPAKGAIPAEADEMRYDAEAQTLHIGDTGRIVNVTAAMWEYEVSGKRILTQWFSYRKKNRVRPIIGDRRKPSPLGEIQPDGWLAEYTTELLNVLNVIGRLVLLEPAQADILERVRAGRLIDAEAVDTATEEAARRKKQAKAAKGPSLFAE